MRKVSALIGLTVVALILYSCQSTPFDRITRFTLSNESVKLAPNTETKRSIWVTVAYETTSNNNNASLVVLADGELVDGELLLNQRVTEPTKVLISAHLGDEDNNRQLNAVLRPNAEVDFVLEYSNLRSYKLTLVGSNHRSLDESRKFSLVGNISALEGVVPNPKEPSLTYVAVVGLSSNLDDSRSTLYYPSVLVDEGKFSIEGDVDQPTLVKIEIWGRNTSIQENLYAIFEPGVNYSLVPLGNSGKLVVKADRDSVHSRSISSWQLDPEYVSLIEQWMVRQEVQQDQTKAVAEHRENFVNNYSNDEECGHLNVPESVKLKFVEPFRTVQEKLGDQIVRRRSHAIREILREVEDPELAQLVFDLSWSLFSSDEIDSEFDTHEKAAMLMELANHMDQEFVDNNIEPQVEDIMRRRKLVLNNRSLRPGQTAPEFSLKTIAGDEISLKEVLSENELVLVDFWASWCGPCIRSFPALKKMYAQYKDRGFEILTIAIDDSFEDWEDASKSQKLPWIDLGDTENGEMKEWKVPPSAQDYGVRGIPSKFLIDKEGCIVHKRFTVVELKKMLSARLADTN
ncbi:MAG: TlpA disulfide reductase family protein [Gammaproteobacteria bacterium]|nr:TlpA disulfide reductase family protein [Gammaproteobacteria bacterium]